MFECKNNKFLATMINKRKLKEIHFTYDNKGQMVMYSNLELLDIFFKNATRPQLIQAQQILKAQNFSENAINDFIYHFGKDFLLKLK